MTDIEQLRTEILDFLEAGLGRLKFCRIAYKYRPTERNWKQYQHAMEIVERIDAEWNCVA